MNLVHKILITEIDKNLRGIGRINNKVIDFNYTNLGDEVIAEEFKKGKKKKLYYKEKIKNNTEHSLVQCKHFYFCRGCIAQHIEYKNQFRLKTSEILKVFREIYNIDIKTIPAKKIYGYRNRMDFAVFPGPTIGLRKSGSYKYIVNIEECKIQSEWANQALQNSRRILEQFKDICYDRKTEMGYIKYVTLRNNSDSSDNIVIFTIGEDFQVNPQKKDFAEMCIKELNTENIIFCFNRKQSENSCEGSYEIIKGKNYYSEKISEKKLKIPFNSFAQPNPEGFQPILEFINENIQNKNQKVLFDLFCGSGFFSVIFGKKFNTLIGMDSVDNSILMAGNNLKEIYPEKSIKFIKQDLFKEIKLPEFEEENAVAIIDPPRSGMGQILSKALIKKGPNLVFYVSCNPYTQLQDLLILKDKYKVINGIITDPYPHTPHSESVILLERYN